MKKSFLLFSSIAVSLLMIFISCTKENISTPNPYVKKTAPGYVDTPYGRTFKPVTPYFKTNPVVQSFVDTPYGRTFKPVTPFLKTYPVVQSFVDTPYGKKHGK